MRLSVCCATGDPPAQVARVLAPLRPVADEIVVAYDARVDPMSLGPVARIADRLVRFPFGDYVEQALTWLHSLCAGDWILRLDGDEVISHNLIGMLPELVSDRRMQQYYLGYRWLYPDADHWLAEPPWSFDTNRLVRNDPATLWFPGLCHSVAEPAFPAGYPDTALYHLSWLTSSPARLADKVEHYLRMPSDHDPAVIARDVPVFYRPDLARHTPSVSVPLEDRALIHDVLAARDSQSPDPPPAEVPLADWSQVTRHWAHRPLGAEAYRADVQPLDDDLSMDSCEERAVPVRICNRSREVWPGGEDRHPLIRLGYRWVGEAGGRPGADPFTVLPGPVPPGQAAIVRALVRAPELPGRHRVRFDLVHGTDGWFRCDSAALDVNVPERD